MDDIIFESNARYKHFIPNSFMMIDTNVVPHIKKNADVLALDIGGTNVRKSIVHFDKNGCEHILNISKTPTRNLMITNDFFSSLATFLLDEKVFSNEQLKKISSIALCFSYPFKPVSGGDAVISGSAKGIVESEFKDKLLIKSILEALYNKGVYLEYKGVVVNDATSSLLYLSLITKNKDSIKLGAIVGTGCNVAIYLNNEFGNKRAICTEAGHLSLSFKHDNLISTFDKQVDKEMSTNGKSNFEIITSGFYIFRVLKNIITSLLDENIIDNKSDIESLNSFVENLKGTEDITKYYYESDNEVLFYIISLVIKRASLYFSSLLLAYAVYSTDNTSNDIKKRDIDVYIEGSTYHLLPLYKDYTEMLIKKYAPKFSLGEFCFHYPNENNGKTILLGASVADVSLI